MVCTNHKIKPHTGSQPECYWVAMHKDVGERVFAEMVNKRSDVRIDAGEIGLRRHHGEQFRIILHMLPSYTS